MVNEFSRDFSDAIGSCACLIGIKAQNSLEKIVLALRVSRFKCQLRLERNGVKPFAYCLLDVCSSYVGNMYIICR